MSILARLFSYTADGKEATGKEIASESTDSLQPAPVGSILPTGIDTPLSVPILTVQLMEVGRVNVDIPSAISTTHDVVTLFSHYLGCPDREHIVAIFLDVHNRITGITTVSIGTPTTASCHARELLKPAIMSNAISILLCHNHPGGSVQPSQEDIDFTKRMADAAKLVGITVSDHVIIARGGQHSSLKSLGHI